MAFCLAASSDCWGFSLGSYSRRCSGCWRLSLLHLHGHRPEGVLRVQRAISRRKSPSVSAWCGGSARNAHGGTDGAHAGWTRRRPGPSSFVRAGLVCPKPAFCLSRRAGQGIWGWRGAQRPLLSVCLPWPPGPAPRVCVLNRHRGSGKHLLALFALPLRPLVPAVPTSGSGRLSQLQKKLLRPGVALKRHVSPTPNS